MTNENTNKIVDALKLAVRSLTGGKASIEVGTSGNAMCLRILVHRAEYGKVCGSKGKRVEKEPSLLVCTTVMPLARTKINMPIAPNERQEATKQ